MAQKINQNTIDDTKGAYPPEVHDALQYLFGYCNDKCGGDRNRLSARLKQQGLKFAPNTLYQFFTGRMVDADGAFKGSVDNYNAAAETLRDAELGRFKGGAFPPVETDVMRLLRNAINTTRKPGRVCKWLFVTGTTASQKTFCCKWYAAEVNSGRTVYREAPDVPDLNVLTYELAQSVGKVANGARRYERVQHLSDNLNENHCVIIDNAQRLYNPRTGNTQACFSFLQRLQDETGCAIVLVFVKETFTRPNAGKRGPAVHDPLDDILFGPAAGFFGQFLGRIGGEENILRLPDESSDADLLAFAHAAGLKGANAKTVLPVLRFLDKRDGRLRIVIQNLQDAADRARAAGRDETHPGDLLNYLATDALDDKQRDKLQALIAKSS